MMGNIYERVENKWEKEKIMITSITFFSNNIFKCFFYFITYLFTKQEYCAGFKAFADDKLKVVKIKISVFDRMKNIVGKGENAGYQYFLPFPQCFQKGHLKCGEKVRIIKIVDCLIKSLTHYQTTKF